MTFIQSLSMFFIGAVAPIVAANSATTADVEAEPYFKNDLCFRRFEMEGHTYIYFMERSPDGMKQLIHDPDCKCFKK